MSFRIALVLVLFASSVHSADGDFIPTTADELRRIADGIDENRRTGDWIGARTGIVLLAKAVLEGKSNGAFVLSNDRWVGAGDYLNEVLELLSTEEQARAVDAIDLLVEALLAGRSKSGDEELLLRIARDFPRCRSAERARLELSALYLARGQLASYLQMIPPGADPTLASEVEALRPGSAASAGPRSLAPFELSRSLGRIPRETPQTRYPGPLRLPAWDQEFFYWFSDDGLTCARQSNGDDVWTTPLLPGALSEKRLPGSVSQPALRGALVFATTPASITAYDRRSGQIRFDLELLPLFDLDDEARKDCTVLSVTSPVACEHGVLFAAALLQKDRVECRLVLLAPDGKKRWDVSAGGVHGATYLALGMAEIGLAAQGLNAYVLTGRGLLSSYHLTDGSLAWAVRYQGMVSAGAEDALRKLDRFLGPPLACRGDVIAGAPADASSLFLWDRASGVLRAAIPRLDGKWWSWGGNSPSAPFAVTGERGVQFWQVEAGKPRALGNLALPDSFPDISGRGTGDGEAWWFPCAGGFYFVRDSGKFWQFVPTSRACRRADSIAAIGEGILLGKENEAYYLRPSAVDSAGPRALIARARQALYARDLVGLDGSLDALLAKRPPAPFADALDTLVAEVVELAHPGYLGLGEADLSRLEQKALELLPMNDVRAKNAFRLARAHLTRGDVGSAIALSYRALEPPVPTRVELLPDLFVPLELAARALLASLARNAPDSPAWPEWEQKASLALEQAVVRDTLEEFRKVGMRYPYTRGGRRAALESARKFFEHGNRNLAIEELELLVLTDADATEAIEARFRLAELYRDERRIDRARRVLDELTTKYGKLTVRSERGESTVAARAAEFAALLPVVTGGDPPSDASVQLLPVWRWRSELGYQRGVQVYPLGDTALFITISKRSAAVHDAVSGKTLWTVNFPRPEHSLDLPLWADHDRLGPPLLFSQEALVLEDGESLYALDTLTGAPRWTRPAPSGIVSSSGLPHRVIQRARGEGDMITVISEDLILYGIEASIGAIRWQTVLDGPPCGDEEGDAPEMRAGRLVIGYNDLKAPRAVLMESRTGKVLREFEFPAGNTLVQPPWFLTDDHIVFALKGEESGTLVVLDGSSGAEVWRQELAKPLRIVHRECGAPFLVAELNQQEGDDPEFLLGRGELVGFAEADGRKLWTWSSRTPRAPLKRVEYSAGRLLLLEGDYGRRKLVSLRVPPILLTPPVPADIATFELETEWTEALSKGPDDGALFYHRDWILLQDRYRCDLTVLTRDGNVDRTAKFDVATRFVADRRELYWAGFIGETLVLLTQRGSLGLRPLAPLELAGRYWEEVRDFPFANATDADYPPGAAATAYRADRLEESCRLLDRELDRPGVRFESRRQMARQLEGVAQERAENNNLHFSVPRMPRPPVIDGVLDEPWNAATTITLRAPRYFNPMQGSHEQPGGSWRDWTDLSAELHLGWSEEGFHLALEVIDDHVYPYDRDLPEWTGDCLLLAFDLGDNGGLIPDDDDQLLTLALTTQKPKAPPGAGAQGQQPAQEEAKPSGRFNAQRRPDDSGVNYEVTLPWSTFAENRPPETAEIPYVGMSFRINLALTDDDTGRGAKSYMSLSPAGQKLTELGRSVWEMFAPKYFARIRLAP